MFYAKMRVMMETYLLNSPLSNVTEDSDISLLTHS